MSCPDNIFLLYIFPSFGSYILSFPLSIMLSGPQRMCIDALLRAHHFTSTDFSPFDHLQVSDLTPAWCGRRPFWTILRVALSMEYLKSSLAMCLLGKIILVGFLWWHMTSPVSDSDLGLPGLVLSTLLSYGAFLKSNHKVIGYTSAHSLPVGHYCSSQASVSASSSYFFSQDE